MKNPYGGNADPVQLYFLEGATLLFTEYYFHSTLVTARRIQILDLKIP